jgi:SPP1 family predicted phage head-tail adaptor
MQAGKMDRRVTFQKQSTDRDELGQYENIWTDEFTVWARATPISDGEKFGGAEVKAYATHRFQIRYSTAAALVTPTWRMVFEGATFDISGIKEIGRREGFEITATKRAE